MDSNRGGFFIEAIGKTIVCLAAAIFMVIYSGCSPKQASVDEKNSILSQQELSSFLIEMYLAEARMEGRPLAVDSVIHLFVPYETKLLKKYNLTDSTLKLTYQYYLDHPKQMEQVYDVVIDSLNLREQQTN